MEMDASNHTYSAVLTQQVLDNLHHPIVFFSKSMNPAERNYGISDKEALAIVKALQHWRHWLEGSKFPIEILTDHCNLEYFTKPRILNRRQLRWLDLLAHYNYNIVYRPGSNNGAADALSRKAELAPEQPEEEEPTTLFPEQKFLAIESLLTELSEEETHDYLQTIILAAIHTDQDIQQQIHTLLPLTRLPKTVELHNDQLAYHREQIFVPEDNEIKRNILALHHDSLIAGHLGRDGTIDLVK